jgi:Fe-S-cluster-containing dehydrogenase component
VVEQVLNDGRTFNYVPIPTDLCDLCARRTGVENKAPTCVHHCLAQVMRFGPIDELARHMIEKPRSVIWAPRPRTTSRRPFDAVLTSGEGSSG